MVKKGHDKITVIFPVTSDNFLSATTTLLTGDIYIYIHSIYAMRMCLWYLWSCHFLYNIYVCHDFFNELCKYIMYNCRLMLVLICWYMSWYKFVVVINRYTWFTCLLCDLVQIPNFFLNTVRIIRTVELLAI